MALRLNGCSHSSSRCVFHRPSLRPLSPDVSTIRGAAWEAIVQSRQTPSWTRFRHPNKPHAQLWAGEARLTHLISGLGPWHYRDLIDFTSISV